MCVCVCVCMCVCKKAAAQARAAFHSIFIDSTFALSLCIEHQGRCEEKEKVGDVVNQHRMELKMGGAWVSGSSQ